jgi:hypothetical protein
MAVEDTESTQGAMTVKARLKRYLTALVSTVAAVSLLPLAGSMLPVATFVAGGSV